MGRSDAHSVNSTDSEEDNNYFKLPNDYDKEDDPLKLATLPLLNNQQAGQDLFASSIANNDFDLGFGETQAGGSEINDLLGAPDSTLRYRTNQRNNKRQPSQQEWKKSKNQSKPRSQGINPNSFHKGGKPSLQDIRDKQDKESPSTAVSSVTVPSRKTKSTTTKTKRKKKPTEEQEDSRPASEKDLFTPLQQAKQLQRRQNSSTMAKGSSATSARRSSRNHQNDPANAENDNERSGTPTESPPVSPNASEGGHSPGGGLPTSPPQMDDDNNQNGQESPGQGDDEVDALQPDDEEEYPGITAYKKKLTAQLQKDAKADGKANAQVRLKNLGKLRVKLCNRSITGFKLKTKCAQNRTDETYTVQLEGKIEKLEKKIAELKSSKMSNDKILRLKVSREHEAKAAELTKSVLWRRYKFITTDEDKEKAGEALFKAMNFENHPNKEGWILTYSPGMTKALADRRNYTTSELKKCAFAMVRSGKTLFTEEQMVSFATRSCGNTEEFRYYWDYILPKGLGKKVWDTKDRHYQIISSKRGDDGKMEVTYATEAFIVLVWINNYEKWPKLQEFVENPDNKGKKPPKELRNGKWTVTDAGKVDLCSWKPEGLEKFNELKKAIKAARKEDKYIQVEREALASIRKEKGFKCATHEEEKRFRKNARKRKNAGAGGPDQDAIVEPPAKKVCTNNDSDSEEEE